MLSEAQRAWYNDLGTQVVDSCMTVHREMGPGLLESVYQFALLKEFELRRIRAQPHVGIELLYKGHPTGKLYECDILVENAIILELKSVEQILSVHTAQIISYLKLTGKHLGYLLQCPPSKRRRHPSLYPRFLKTCETLCAFVPLCLRVKT